MRTPIVAACAAAFVASFAAAARAEEPHDSVERSQDASEKGAPEARSTVLPASSPPQRQSEQDPEKTYSVGGYLEAFYLYSFERPGNELVPGRGYDVRANTIALQNAVLDTGFHAHDLIGRLALQSGVAPATYYQQEPNLPGTDGAAANDPGLWRYLQRASIGWQATDILLVEAGLFNSSFGFEGIAVKDNFTWSRSNMATRLPNYLTGVKATVNVSKHVDVVSGVVNGWNRVVDDNDEKTVFLTGIYKQNEFLTASLSYYGGVERPGGAPEGRAWRHTAQAFAEVDPTHWLELVGDGVVGLERTRFGSARFGGGAFTAHAEALPWLGFAGRLDALFEDPGRNALGTSTPILMDAGRIVSETATIEVKPLEKGLSTRLEYRHDQADDDLWFHGTAPKDPSGNDVPNVRHQNTLLLGVTGWF